MSIPQNIRNGGAVPLMFWAQTASVAELTDWNTYVGLSANELQFISAGLSRSPNGTDMGGVAGGDLSMTPNGNIVGDWQGG
jgi:hypothetical protein